MITIIVASSALPMLSNVTFEMHDSHHRFPRPGPQLEQILLLICISKVTLGSIGNAATMIVIITALTIIIVIIMVIIISSLPALVMPRMRR